ncbi:hypothetical protein AX16_003206 [Volvariella volvacea WC 439]|nr:hypothetical protein AX16_003206 [Volvariella volvacea WC 439]
MSVSDVSTTTAPTTTTPGTSNTALSQSPPPLSSSPEPHQDDSDTRLTPQRAHYLKKYLIQLQFRRELDAIVSNTTNVSPLSYLGPPFSPPPKHAPHVDLPLLRYIFRQFVLTFPFMAAAPKDFYSDKLQPFVASILSRNLSSTFSLDESAGSAEKASQVKLMTRIERNLALFIGAATKIVEREEVVRLSQTDLDRIETLAKKRQARMSKRRDAFDVNIVSVRTVTDKGRMRSRVHEEFIIRTRRSRYPDIYVSRRYGDFRTLANELRKAHPEETIRQPPNKDRTVVNIPSSTVASPISAHQPAFSDIPDTPTTPGLPESVYHARPSRLAREKNRLTLRSYLHSLMSSSTIASSPVLMSFLLSGPTTLSREEMEDARRREEADRVRDEGRKRFAKEIANRVDSLRDAVRSVKGDLLAKDGLTHVFAIIKVNPDIRRLPQNYKAVVEWARITLASKVFQHFVASDDASEMLASLKRIHGLMPYFMLKTTLKISNPIAMIRSVLDLFLAQPFGGKSLLQRMFTSSLTEEVKQLEEQIEAVKDKVDDPIMCLKVRQFVYAAREIQELYKADAAQEKLHVLTLVLRSPEEPVLSRTQIHRLAKAQRAHAVYLRTREALDDSDDDDGPQDEDAWLLEDLKVLAHLYSRLRDREQLIALIFEGFTAELLKDIITIFYSPLAQVYRAASVADSIGDLQNFVNDLIRTVEDVEELSQEDPHRTVQTFIDLIQRHEQAFYSFVHKVHSKGDGLFDSLMRWIELFLTVVREGLGEPICLEFLLPHVGKERADILSEVDQLALYHYKLKVLYEDKLRRRFGRAQGQNEVEAEDEATQILLDSVVGEISFGEVVQGDADDIAAEETEDSDGSSSDYETGSSSGHSVTSSDSEDSAPRQSLSQAHTPPTSSASRSSTSPLSTPSPVHGSKTSPPPPPTRPSLDLQRLPQPRRRSLSLKSMKSMPFLGGASNARRNQDLPPVPPLSSTPLTANIVSKPLPHSPVANTPVRLTTPSVPTGESSRSANKTSTSSQPKKKQKETLKPPELVHIPQLLPIFTEMMRPLLSLRKMERPSPASS